MCEKSNNCKFNLAFSFKLCCSYSFIITRSKEMIIDLERLYDTVIHQLSSFWTIDKIDESDFLADIEKAKEITVNSYDKSSKSYYKYLGFSEMNSSVYTVFLCHLSRLVGNRRGGVYCFSR